MENSKERVTFFDHVRLGFCAGLLALVFLGVLETVLVLARRSFNPQDFSALLWGAVVYGLLGAGAGIGLGFGGGIVTRILARARERGTVFAFYWTTLFSLPLLVIARFRIRRDVFAEKLRTTEPKGILVHLGLLLVIALLYFLCYRYLIRGMVRKGVFRGWLSVRGALATYAVVLVLSSLFALFPRFFGRGAQLRVPPPEQTLLSGKPNILLIGIDTMRADHLSCYGYGKNTSPNIDRLAGDGVQFRKAFAQSSWTKPGFATILTSLYPSSHRAIGKADRIPQGVTTLAEVLKGQGYITAGFADNVNVSEVFGFNQGFDYFLYLKPNYFFRASEAAADLTVYEQLRLIRERFLAKTKYVQNYYQSAEVVNRHVLAWLQANKDERMFLFVHYMDPHDPYFVHPYNGVGYARVSMPNPDPKWADTFGATYDGEVAYVDQYIGALLDWLRREGLYDKTLVVLTGDHGEEFYEHKGWWHGDTLYDEQIHIPLIFKLPQSAMAGTEVGPQVRALDIAPSILSLSGVRVPPQMQGRSLFPGGNITARGEAQVFSEEDFEGNILRSLRTPEWKLIQANKPNPRGLEAIELYDLAGDPGERANLAPAKPGRVAELSQPMERIHQYALGQAAAPEAGELDQATRDRLRALGYVQ